MSTSTSSTTGPHRRERLLGSDLDLEGTKTLDGAVRRTLDAALEIDEVDAAWLHQVDPETGELRLAGHRGLSGEQAASMERVERGAARAALFRGAPARGVEVRGSVSGPDAWAATFLLPIRHQGRLLMGLGVASRRTAVFPAIALYGLRAITARLAPALSRFEAQTALERSQATLRSLAQSAPAGIGLVRGGRFRWVNEHMVHLVGTPARGLVGQSPRVLFLDEDEYRRVDEAMRGSAGHAAVGSVETRWARRDGTSIDVMLSFAALDPKDDAEGIVFTAWDVTRRNRVEGERRELERQVQQAQRLESLGVLAGGIAHDFNNILHAVVGHAGLAAKSLPPEGRARYHVEEIEQAVERASLLCRQMLAYSGRGSFLIERLDLGDAVRALGSMLEVSLPKGVELRLDIDEAAPSVEADPSQIQQVIMNLITNAGEAIGEQAGLVRVTVSTMTCDAARLAADFEAWSLEPGTYVTLTVEDTGCGMDADTRQRIFEPFFTTKFTGRGLGLAAIQGIVRAHRGAIHVSSEPERGTRMTVLFPPAAPEAERRRRPARTESRSGGGHGVVLLADDDPRLLEISSLMLEEAGYAVVTAENGQEAVDRFLASPGSIQCAILDLTMPVLDGVETCRVLRRERPDLPVILSSGYSARELRSRFGEDAPDGFLEKPFTSDVLLELLDGLGTGRAAPAPAE